jgi:hypothetical protein
MPDWEMTDILAIKKASQPKAWLEALLAQTAKSAGENKSTSLGAISEQVLLLKLLQEFLAGYGEEGKHAQFLQPSGGLLIRWPVPIARTGRLNKVFCNGLESARKNVDQIFLVRLKLNPYRGRLPVWILYDEGEVPEDARRRTAGRTFGGALIMLHLPRPKAEQSRDPDHWAVSEQDIQSLMETARHEFVHFYIDRMLGEEKANRLPREFHEGCATSLTNSSTIERSDVRVEVTPNGEIVRRQTIESAPEDYQRYHLQMKYLRLAYGDTTFFAFLRSVLSGADLNASVKASFDKDSWTELFPEDLSAWMVNRVILRQCVYLFASALVGLGFLLAFWRRSNPGATWRAFCSLFKRDFFEDLSRAVLRSPGKKRPAVRVLVAAVVIVVLAERYLRWTNELDIDSPAALVQKALLVDSGVVSLVLLAFLFVGAVRIIFFRKLKNEAIHIFNESENANANAAWQMLQKVRQVNALLKRLKLSRIILRDSRDFTDLQASGRKTESAVRDRIARDLHSRVEELLKQHDCQAAYQACSRLAHEMEGEAPFRASLAALLLHIAQRLIETEGNPQSWEEAIKLRDMWNGVVRLGGFRDDEVGTILSGQ